MNKLWSTYKSSVLLLASMVIGGVVGFFWGPGAAILQPLADIFLNLLYCCVVPLIFCSLTAAIAKMEDLSKLKKIMSIFLGGHSLYRRNRFPVHGNPLLVYRPGTRIYG